MKKSEGIKICLLVEPLSVEMSHSIYMIELPADDEVQVDSEGFMINDAIYPTISVNEHTPEQGGLISGCAMIKLGSRIYFFGGGGFFDLELDLIPPDHIPLDKRLSVRFLDTDHLERGFQSAASLNFPKDVPCVFSANNLIYALASPCTTGNPDPSFERYDPESDQWELLPKPPIKTSWTSSQSEINWCDCATVVNDRYVFLGNVYANTNFVFDISTSKWLPIHSTSLCFPFGSLYVDGSLYHLKGHGSHKFGTRHRKDNDYTSREELKLVKTGPLSVSPNSFSFPVRHGHVMATRKELDQGFSFPDDTTQWRQIFHLGGRFFCYVVTALLLSYPFQDEYHGVHIKVFEEVVPRLNSTPKEAPFRILASFSYRIHTPQYVAGPFFRCCAFGSVPHSWVEAPLRKKVITKETKATEADEQSQHEHGGGSKGQSASNPVKMVEVPEAEFSRLKSQLAEMEKRLKAYETSVQG